MLLRHLRRMFTVKPNEPLPARLITVFMVLAAVCAWADLAGAVARLPWNEFFWFVLLCVLATLYPVLLPKKKVSASVSSAIDLASLIIFGPAGILITTASSMATVWIRFALRLDIAAFNLGQVAVSAWTAGKVWIYTGGLSGVSPELPDQAVPLVLTTLTFFIVNILLISLSISMAHKQRFSDTLAANFGWMPMNLAVAGVIAILIARVHYTSFGMVGVYMLCLPLLLIRYSIMQYMNLKAQNVQTVEALAAAIDAKDPYTRGHSERVAEIAEKIAKAMRLKDADVEMIRYAGLLHDIGKIGVTDKILQKTGRLSEEEFSMIKHHPTVGAEMVKPVQFLDKVLSAIRHHHEQYGGGGYPDGLKGEEIPLWARILCVADAWDAMTVDRVYRRNLGREKAIQQLIEGKGVQFDPHVVDVFLDHVVDSLPELTESGIRTTW